MSAADVEKILKRVESAPDDVQARIDAAHHCDACRAEEDAVVHHDRAWELSVPEAQRQDFMIGHGSTLKNVGRLPQSESILSRAVQEAPGAGAGRVFLALTLLESGRATSALGQLIELLLDREAGRDVLRYERALRGHARELIDGDSAP